MKVTRPHTGLTEAGSQELGPWELYFSQASPVIPKASSTQNTALLRGTQRRQNQ